MNGYRFIYSITALLAALTYVACGKKIDVQDNGSLAADNIQLKILSFNAYLLKTGLKNAAVDQRAQMIPDSVAAERADIVVLQEVWEADHVDFFIKRMQSHGYPYVAYVDSRDSVAKLGNGMMIFSIYPFVQNSVRFEPWTTKTSWTEKKASKGILSALVNINGRMLHVVNAHTSTKRIDSETGLYDKDHEAERKVQFDQIIDNLNQQSSPYQFVAADLNMHPFALQKDGFSENILDPEYEYFKNNSGLENVFSKAQLSSEITYDPQNNHWAADGIIVDDTLGQLIDYQMFKGPLRHISSRIALTQRVSIPNGLTVVDAPLSDHYGIFSEFTLGAEKAP